MNIPLELRSGDFEERDLHYIKLLESDTIFADLVSKAKKEISSVLKPDAKLNDKKIIKILNESFDLSNSFKLFTGIIKNIYDKREIGTFQNPTTNMLFINVTLDDFGRITFYPNCFVIQSTPLRTIYDNITSVMCNFVCSIATNITAECSNMLPIN